MTGAPRGGCWASNVVEAPYTPFNPVTPALTRVPGYNPVSGAGSVAVEFTSMSVTSNNLADSPEGEVLRPLYNNAVIAANPRHRPFQRWQRKSHGDAMRCLKFGLFAAVPLLLAACGGSESGNANSGASGLRVMTFNVGIPECSDDADSPYTCEDAEIAGEWYGTGLSHQALFPDTRAFIASIAPDVVGLQEIFHPEACPDIPPEFHPGFICETWQLGQASVGQRILGPDYQIACHDGRPDKCLAVRRSFGRFRGCASDLCLDFLDGGQTADCGGGTRIGRGVIDLVAGGSITVVNVHGTSGITTADQACRVEQFEQIFVDILDGSGMPAANGLRNIVLGDLNTDPGRLTLIDPSAATWAEHVGSGLRFNQISDAGVLATPTYADLLNIDHVAADAFTGSCFAGVPTDITAYDHVPIVCDLSPQP